MRYRHTVYSVLWIWLLAGVALAQSNELDVKVTLRLAVTSNSLTLVHKETTTRKAAAEEAAKQHKPVGGGGIVGVLDREVTQRIGELGSDTATPAGGGSSSTAAGGGGGPPIAKSEEATSTATLVVTGSPEINGRAIALNAKIVSLNTVVEKFSDETDADYKARALAFKTKVLDAANALIQSLNQAPLNLSGEEERTLIKRAPVAKDLPAEYFEDNKQKLVITVTAAGLIIDGKLGS